MCSICTERAAPVSSNLYLALGKAVDRSPVVCGSIVEVAITVTIAFVSISDLKCFARAEGRAGGI